MDIDPMETTCSDSNPNRSISPMECESNTDIQTDQGSWGFVNETKEDMDRTSDSVQHDNQHGTDARYCKQPDPVQHGNQDGTGAMYSKQPDSVQHDNQHGTDARYCKHPDPVQHGIQHGTDARYSKQPDPVQHGIQHGTDARYSKQHDSVQYDNQHGTDARYSKHPDPVQHGNQGGTDARYSKHPDPIQHGNQGGTDARYSKQPDSVQYGNQHSTDGMYSRQTDSSQHGNHGNDRNSRVYPDPIHNASFNNSQRIRNDSPMGQMHLMKEPAPHQQSIYINQSYTRIPNPNMVCWPFKVYNIHPPYPTNDPLKITVVRHQPTENHSNPVSNQKSHWFNGGPTDFPQHRLFSPNDNDNLPLNSQQSNDILNSQRQQHLYTNYIQHVEHQNLQGGPRGFQCPSHSSEGFQQQVDYPQNSPGGTVNPNYQLAQTSTMYHGKLNGDKLRRIHEGQSLSHTTFTSSHINPKENIPKVQPIATNLKRDTNDTTVTCNMTENYPQKTERTVDHACQVQEQPAYGDEKNTDTTRNRPDGNRGLEKKRDTYDTTFTHNMTENYPQKIERTEDHACQVQERPAYGDEKNTDTRNIPDGNRGLETEENRGPVNSITTDQTRSVLVELKDQQFLDNDKIKFALRNKKKGGGPIEKLIYSSVKNQYLVIFEDSNDAMKIVNTNFQVSGVPLKLSLYWEDPENFDKQQKPEPMKIKVKSCDICRVKFIVQNNKLLQDFQRRLRVKCEYKSMLKDSGEYLMTFDLLEYVDDLESKSADAAGILKSIADDLVQDVVEVSNGINLKLQVKELDQETKDVILTCSGQKVYIVSRSRKMVKEYKQKIDTMIKEHHDEMKRKNEKLDKINLEPVEKQFFQRYLLESEKLKQNNVMLTLDETCVTVKGQQSDCNDSVQFIYDKLSKVPCQIISDVNSLEHLFLKENIQTIESRLNEKNLKVCIGMKKDQLVILSSDKNDGIQAENIVKDSFTSNSLSVETTQFLRSREWQSLVSAIKEKHGTKVMIETDSKANKMKIVGVPNIVREVSNEIEEYLDSITKVSDNVSADGTKMDYIRRYEYGKISDIEKKCNLAIDCNSLPWKLNGTKKSVEKGKSCVISFIDDIKAHTVVMNFIGIVSLFTQPRGKEIISRIGEETNCLIVEENKIPSGSTDEVPLRQWKLPNGKKIEVLKTDMRKLRCDAIVNAANSYLSHGAGLAGAIVEMGGYEIQKECTKYVSSKGEVKVGEVMVGSSGHLPCKKIIHAVGPVWHNGTRNEATLLENAIFHSLKAADKNNFSSIAIPAISTGIFRYPMADACKIIVETIVEYLVKSNGTLTHVLLCDIKEDSLTAFIKSLSFELGEKNGSDRKESVRDEIQGAVGGVSYPDHSNTDEPSDAEDNGTSASDSGDSVDDNSGELDNDSVKSTMNVKSGEITKQQVDVIVNCTSEKLNLKSGAVSRAILEAAGSSIQSECDKCSGGISPGDIAVTSGGKLSCKKIYHTCIQSYTADKSQARKTLEVSIQKILETSTKSGFKSIAIPALGCGHLGFPADVSAKIVFETTKKFFTSTPETSLKEINFVVHPKDTSVLKAYSEIGKDFDVLVVTTPSYSKHRQTNRNEKLSFGKLTIEICQGDLTKESTDCIVNVCTQSMELKYGISKLISEKGGSDIAKECSQRKSDMKKDGILITGSGKLRCSAICHLLIQKSSHDWTDIIKKALYKINKEEFESVSLPAIGTGGLKVNPKESAEFIMSALKSYGEKVKHPKLTKVRVVIYQKEHVSEFLKVFNGDGHKRYHDAPSHRGREHRQTNQKPIRRDMNEIKLTIYSNSLTNIEHTKQKLHDRFRGEMLTKKIPQYLQDMIEKLDSRQIAKLKDIAESFYVILKYDKSSKEINLNGLTKQVTDCCDQIVDRLQSWKSSEQKNSEKAILSKYVDWVYEEKSGGRTHSLGPGISAMLEKAKMNKDTEIEFTDHKGRKYTVNLKEMKEYPRHGSPVKIHRIEKGVVKGSKLLKGEKEALSGDTTKYFTLLPERNYDASKAEEYHFRLAESQFSRLLQNSGNYSVTKVEYVVNPVLNKKFRAAQKELKDNLGEENSLPVLAFHGTNVDNIKLICENGFKKQGDSGFSQSHGAKYGQGVYFSEYPDYSMRYIHGSTKLLLCQVLIGKSFTCTSLRGSNGQVEPGYDSHISSDKKELVIFKTERILPCYIVHYAIKSGDYQY